MTLLFGATVAVADTFPVARLRSTIEETADCYRDVPTVSANESWGARELRRMRESARPAGAAPGLPDADEFAKAFRVPEARAEAGAQGVADANQPVFGPAAAPARDQVFDVGLALPADVISDEEYLQLLGEVPEGAMKLADYMIAYTDGTVMLLLNLKSILATDVQVDWESLLRDEETLENSQFRAAKKARRAKAAEEEVESSSSAMTRIVVRSTFRIVVGVTIGLMLWMIVRKL